MELICVQDNLDRSKLNTQINDVRGSGENQKRMKRTVVMEMKLHYAW